MDVLASKTDRELYYSLLAEIAKAGNEISCAEGDIRKAKGRLGFTILVLNALIDRTNNTIKD